MFLPENVDCGRRQGPLVQKVLYSGDYWAAAAGNSTTEAAVAAASLRVCGTDSKQPGPGVGGSLLPGLSYC